MPIEYAGSVKISGQYYDATEIKFTSTYTNQSTTRCVSLRITLKLNQTVPVKGEWIVIRSKAGKELFAGTIRYRVSLDSRGHDYRLHCEVDDGEQAEAVAAETAPATRPVDPLMTELRDIFDRIEDFANRQRGIV